jgi:hypothetical protein
VAACLGGKRFVVLLGLLPKFLLKTMPIYPKKDNVEVYTLHAQINEFEIVLSSKVSNFSHMGNLLS